jgi:TolA-binding protein
MEELGMRALALAFVTALVLALPAAAQTPVTTPDIQRLQDSLSQAASEVSTLRSRDGSLAGRLQGEIEDLREEVIYLKVKLRKERSVARSEYADVRDRIDDLRSRATATTSTSSSAAPRSIVPAVPAPVAGGYGSVEVPVGTEIEVRMIDRLSSGTSKVEDRFEATTLADLSIGGRTVIPAGAAMRGVVTDVQPATRTNRTGKMTVSFDQVTIN